MGIYAGKGVAGTFRRVKKPSYLSSMKKLHIIIKKKYFHQILSGEKKEEFRVVSPHWASRLTDKPFEVIIFQNGYAKDAPRFEAEYLGHEIKNIKHEFFGGDFISVFAIKIGKLL